MAHFAELDGDKKVIRVCVVDNAHVPSDKHADGETWCANFWTGTWKQTSYNNKFRKQFAGIGMTYDATKDKFISEKPHASWTLDSDDNWKSPVDIPDDDKRNGGNKYYHWHESVYQGDNSKGWVVEE
jgi:hypothetical protein